MPTPDPRQALGPEDVHGVIESAVATSRGRAGLGIEVELFAFGPRGTVRRTPIAGPEGSLTVLATSSYVRAAADAGEVVGERGWWCLGGDGGRVSFEPGGQLEVSTCYRQRPEEALDAGDALTRLLTAALEPAGISLAAAGIDVWDPGSAPQQLSGRRYPAMAEALAARGPSGATMMRDTCALQLNLDLDAGAEGRARWHVLNLLAPVATASFACSPSPDGRVRSRRSLTWQALDPTRTGFVPRARDDDRPLAAQLEDFALEADVLFVTEGPEGSTSTPAPPGWRFGDWVRHGHPRFGRPTREDLERHLTTLFPEVRPRGHVEVRSVDAVPARWRRAVATLYLGAVYDPAARDRILEVLTSRPEPLPEQLRAAAVDGLADPSRCAVAVEVWSFALEGAARLGEDAVARADLEAAADLLDRFTLRGRCPADDLLERLRADPHAALTWALEPDAARQEARP